MLNMDEVNMQGLKHDLLKVTTFSIVARFLTLYLDKKGDLSTLFEEEFVRTTVYTLIGFIAFWIIIEPYLIGSAKKP